MRLARPEPPNAAQDDELPGWALEVVALMARKFGQLHVSIWDDPQWVALTFGAQRLYALLLSQKKLTLVGLLTYTPTRWARLAVDTTPDVIRAHLAELEASRFVIVDHETEELIVRTLVRHDITSLANGTANSKLMMGLWRAWTGIDSRQLRQVVVWEIPDVIWDSPRGDPPPEALEMRRSPRIEPPIEPPIEPLVSLNSELGTRNAAADLKQPANSRAPAPPVDNLPLASATVPPGFDDTSRDVPSGFDPPSPAATSSERQQRIEAACQILTDRHLAVVPSRHNPAGHARSVLKGKLTDHAQQAWAVLHTNPELTPAQLADLLEPATPRPAATQRPAPDPFAGQRAAREREMADNAARLAENQHTEPADPEAVARAADEARQALRRAADPNP